MKKQNLIFIGWLAFTMLALWSCGTRTGTGLTIRSASFSPSASLARARFAAPPVTTFKFCVKRLSVRSEGGEEKNFDFQPGLIDVSAGNETFWGTVEGVPSSFKLKHIQIHLHADAKLCGVSYAVKFNDFETSQNTVMKWVATPPTEVEVGDTLKLTLNAFVTALRKAAEDGSLNNNTLRDKLEALEDDASE